MSEQAIKYAYQKLMLEYDLKHSSLNEDAKIALRTLEGIERVNARELKKGNQPSKDVLAKIKALDKWICNEILDIVNDQDDNTPVQDIVKPVEEVAKPVEENKPVKQAEPVGIGEILDDELDLMYDSGQKEWQLDSIKNNFKTVYDVLFKNYDEKGQNGIKTGNFTLLETSEFVFTLKKL